MKRWHEELIITHRNWRNHRRIHVNDNLRSPYGWNTNKISKDPYEVDCECDEQIGRFRKKDAYDCGNTSCWICSSDKFPKRMKTNKEILSEFNFIEQLKEFKDVS